MSAIAKHLKLTSKFLSEYNAEIATKLKEALSLSDAQYDTLVETLKVDDMLLPKLMNWSADLFSSVQITCRAGQQASTSEYGRNAHFPEVPKVSRVTCRSCGHVTHVLMSLS